MKNICLAFFLMMLTFSCQKKNISPSMGLNIFKTVEEFKRSQSSLPCFIEALNGGFFVPSESTAAPDNVLVLQQNNKRRYIREEYQTQGIIRPEWFGAKGDGKTDDLAAFKKAIDKVGQTQGVLVTGSKEYHLSQRILFPGTSRKGGADWIGNGATLDNEIVVNRENVTLKDINVKDSPSNGFRWTRGQGGYFYNLKATNCKKAGFLLGGQKGAQVAWSSFYSLIAIGNEDGFIFDGSHDKNWVNANICDGFFSRNNRRYGILIKGVANYNTFNGLHCEGNGKEDKTVPAMFVDKSRDNIFVGGHLVTSHKGITSVVVDKGANNVYVGGRYVTGNSKSAKCIDAPNSKIEMSRQVIRKPTKGKVNETNWDK